MTRAVFIASGGDPFILFLVYKLFKKYWYNEVDKIYICFNTEMDMESKFIGEVLSRLSQDRKISIIYHHYALSYGEPNRQMLLCSREELILLLEDDGFIFGSGIVDSYFKRIESGEVDALGSPRFSCGLELAEAIKRKYNLDYTGYGDKGPNFWPNFFFCKRSDLLKTDLNFSPKTFQEGEYIKEIDHKMSHTESSDTFGWITMQMRHKGVKFGEIPQYHASPNEIEEFDNKEGKWTNRPPYIHGGSLSSGWSWGGFLLGKQPLPTDPNGLHEIETRVAFWMIASDVVEGFDEFKKEYKQGIENLINQGLDRPLIQAKYKIYKETMGI